MLPQPVRSVPARRLHLDLTQPTTRYMAALALFAIVLAHHARRSSARRIGRVLVAIRENEERTRMLGYDAFANKLAAVVVSGAICAAAGAAYALLFGYVGSTFASVQYSILPLLWVLLGGAATTLGPLVGTLFDVLCRSTSPAATPRPTCLDRRRGADPAGAVLPEGHAGHHRATAGLRWLP